MKKTGVVVEMWLITMLVLNQKGKQQELKRITGEWKTEQGSLHNRSISQYSSAPEYQWIMADYNNKNSRAEALQKELVAPRIVN